MMIELAARVEPLEEVIDGLNDEGAHVMSKD